MINYALSVSNTQAQPLVCLEHVSLGVRAWTQVLYLDKLGLRRILKKRKALPAALLLRTEGTEQT